MVHTPAQLARFQDGDDRVIFAAEGDGPVIELPDGEARLWRAAGRGPFSCPIPGCDAPSLTVVARHPAKRDGFRHEPGAGGHSRESVFHETGKQRIAAWLRWRHPQLEVTVEAVLTKDRQRVADVLAFDPRSTRRWAFEVQYSGLTVAKWRERSDWYRDHDIIDVWLFGHHGKQMRSSPLDQSRVELTPVQVAARERGSAVLWMNPYTREIATAVEMLYLPRRERAETLADLAGTLVIEPMASFALADLGLRTDRLDALRAVDAARGPDDPVRLQRAADEERKRARRAARNRKASRPRQIAEWLASDEGADIATRLPPETFCLTAVWADSLDVPGVVWRSWALDKLIGPIPTGEVVDLAGVGAQVAARFELDEAACIDAVDAWGSVLAGPSHVIERPLRLSRLLRPGESPAVVTRGAWRPGDRLARP